MKAPLYTPTGTKQGTIDLPDQLFAAKINQPLLAQYLRIYSLKQRQNTKKTKTRAEVIGSTAKIWRQKGTGRARHGSRKAPIFVGGAKAHGPDGRQTFELKFPKKMRLAALSSSLSSRPNHVKVVTSLDKIADKTKTLNLALSKLSDSPNQRITIVLENSQSPLIKTAQNLKLVTTTQASRLNPYEVLSSPQLIFTKASIEVLIKTFLNKSTTPTTKASQTKKS